MATIQVSRGLRAVQTVPVIDPSTGRLDARWLTTDEPMARVWGGQERAYTELGASWDGDPATGARIRVMVPEAVSAALEDGRWPVDLMVKRGGITTAVGGCYLSVMPSAVSPSPEPAPRSYITGREFRDIVGPLADALQSDYGQTSNAHILHVATQDLDALIAGLYADGAGVSSERIMQALEQGALVLSVPVRRYVAWRALWYLAQAATGGGAELDRVRQTAALEAARAVRGTTFEVEGYGRVTAGGAVRLIR